MSGHSKWSTIKRQKAANDNARGKEFSKLSRAISIAVKTGGGDNVDSNYKLKVAVDAAKAANMPKDTIQRAITKASTQSDQIDEVLYEGFGPMGIQVLIEAATDNRNRTGQELKNILEKSGGNMGGPGSVSFNFEQMGYILVKKAQDADMQMLDLIDLGAQDVETTEDGVEVYVPSADLYKVRTAIEEKGYEVITGELVYKPKASQDISESETQRIVKLLEGLEDNEDVQNVYTNAEFA